MIPKPTEISDIHALAEILDRAQHDERVDWVRGLGRREQRALYTLARGRSLRADDLVVAGQPYTRHIGQNTLLLFSRFEKRITLHEGAIVGYNENDPLFRRLADLVTGPGHFTAYDSPDVPGEVWIDYRRLPMSAAPGFPPLRSNERGLAALVFGDMVDVLRRVSFHVLVGDAFKGVFARPDRPPLLARIGAWLPTSTFVMCQEPAP